MSAAADAPFLLGRREHKPSGALVDYYTIRIRIPTALSLSTAPLSPWKGSVKKLARDCCVGGRSKRACVWFGLAWHGATHDEDKSRAVSISLHIIVLPSSHGHTRALSGAATMEDELPTMVEGSTILEDDKDVWGFVVTLTMALVVYTVVNLIFTRLVDDADQVRRNSASYYYSVCSCYVVLPSMLIDER